VLTILPTNSVPKVRVGEGRVLPRESARTLRERCDDFVYEGDVLLSPLHIKVVDVITDNDLDVHDAGFADLDVALNHEWKMRSRREPVLPRPLLAADELVEAVCMNPLRRQVHKFHQSCLAMHERLTVCD
jgi:hypothetical protein